MKEVDSQVLGVVDRVLQLQGRGAPITELEDGILGQSIDANPYIRRGGTVTDSGGLFGATISNTHVAADDRTSTMDLYNLTTINAQPPWPFPTGPQFDIWILAASLKLSDSPLVAAALAFDVPTLRQGPIEILGDLDVVLAWWDAVVVVAGLTFATNAASGVQSVMRPYRVPRGVDLELLSTSSAGPLTVTCEMIVGLFPASLGQDGS